MFKEAPPSREAVTTSLTCADSVDVNTFTSSGMIAPARVPHEIMVESIHHREPSPSSRISRNETAYVTTADTIEVSQTRVVSGASKFIFSTLPYLAFAMI